MFSFSSLGKHFYHNCQAPQISFHLFFFSVCLLLKFCLSSGTRPLKSMEHLSINNFFKNLRPDNCWCLLTLQSPFSPLTLAWKRELFFKRLSSCWTEKMENPGVFHKAVLKTLHRGRNIKTNNALTLLFKNRPSHFSTLGLCCNSNQIIVKNEWL